MSVEWVPVVPGRAEIGSDNRSILFGGIGPKHMVEIGYRYSIAKYPVAIAEAEKLLESKEEKLKIYFFGYLIFFLQNRNCM